MRRLVLMLFLAAACGGSSFGSLQGPGSFTPNASMATHGYGAAAPGYVTISLSNSTPAFSCAGLDAGFPDAGIIDGILDIYVEKSSALSIGTIPITDENTYYTSFVPDGGLASGLAWVTLGDGTNPPTNETQFFTESISGSLTFTKVGTEWAGSFTATMVSQTDGGSNPLSGTFDTSNICER